MTFATCTAFQQSSRRQRSKWSRHDLEVLLEGNRAGIQVDEDEAAPRADSRLGQAEVAIADVLEIPSARDRTHAAVELPAEAVKRAAEVLDVLVRQQQLAPAMRAGIVERADRSVGLARDQQRPTDDVVDDRVARLGQLLFAARHLPDARPHPLDFEVEERLRGVARRIERIVAEVTPRALEQRSRHLAAVLREVVLVTGYRARDPASVQSRLLPAVSPWRATDRASAARAAPAARAPARCDDRALRASGRCAAPGTTGRCP